MKNHTTRRQFSAASPQMGMITGQPASTSTPINPLKQLIGGAGLLAVKNWAASQKWKVWFRRPASVFQVSPRDTMPTAKTTIGGSSHGQGGVFVLAPRPSTTVAARIREEDGFAPWQADLGGTRSD